MLVAHCLLPVAGLAGVCALSIVAEVGTTMIVLGLAPWLIVEVLAIGGAALIVGHAAERHHAMLGPGALGFVIAVVAATAPLRTARRSARPD